MLATTQLMIAIYPVATSDANQTGCARIVESAAARAQAGTQRRNVFRSTQPAPTGTLARAVPESHTDGTGNAKAAASPRSHSELRITNRGYPPVRSWLRHSSGSDAGLRGFAAATVSVACSSGPSRSARFNPRHFENIIDQASTELFHPTPGCDRDINIGPSSCLERASRYRHPAPVQGRSAS